MENMIEIYQTSDNQTQIEVRFEEDTVWLTQQQMANLFDQTKQNASLHINNFFREVELGRGATVKKYLTVPALIMSTLRKSVIWISTTKA